MILQCLTKYFKQLSIFFIPKQHPTYNFRKTLFLKYFKIQHSKFCLDFKPNRELSNDCINHSSKQTPPFSASGISEMTVWPAATTCGR